jgi:hypothetical protein
MPLSSPRRREHTGADLAARDLTGGEIRPVNAAPLLRLTDRWDRVDLMAQPLVDLGESCGVHVSLGFDLKKKRFSYFC